MDDKDLATVIGVAFLAGIVVGWNKHRRLTRKQTQAAKKVLEYGCLQAQLASWMSYQNGYLPEDEFLKQYAEKQTYIEMVTNV